MKRFKFNLGEEELKAMFKVGNTVFMQIILMCQKSEMSQYKKLKGLEYLPECLSIA